MPQDLDEDVVMSGGPGGPDTIQARDPMCESTGRKLVRAVESGGGGAGGGLTDAQLRATPVPVSTLAADAGLVALATAIAGASPKTLADLIAILGSTSGAAVVTDANGAVQQYLRGLVKLFGVDGALVKQGGGALTDRSGTVTAGGTSQQIAAALATRKCFIYQNTSDETQYLNFGAAASAANSIEIASKGYWENPPNFCPTGTVNMLGATTAKSFTAKEG